MLLLLGAEKGSVIGEKMLKITAKWFIVNKMNFLTNDEHFGNNELFYTSAQTLTDSG